jgi:hypothetical protein
MPLRRRARSFFASATLCLRGPSELFPNADNATWKGYGLHEKSKVQSLMCAVWETRNVIAALWETKWLLGKEEQIGWNGRVAVRSLQHWNSQTSAGATKGEIRLKYETCLDVMDVASSGMSKELDV